ncbi:50S ribosomal protein L34e [Candidatus Woesearchaeota archaeon]|nr:50S ribosomal protein L34e [Candidatus Woesearchaeota archaeon]
MPRGMFRSRRLRRVFVKTPGSRTVLQYRRRKPSRAHCASCHKPLAGIPREINSIMRNIPKTAKRPQRPYGGMFCSACTRALVQRKARGAA